MTNSFLDDLVGECYHYKGTPLVVGDIEDLCETVIKPVLDSGVWRSSGHYGKRVRIPDIRLHTLYARDVPFDIVVPEDSTLSTDEILSIVHTTIDLRRLRNYRGNLNTANGEFEVGNRNLFMRTIYASKTMRSLTRFKYSEMLYRAGSAIPKPMLATTTTYISDFIDGVPATAKDFEKMTKILNKKRLSLIKAGIWEDQNIRIDAGNLDNVRYDSQGKLWFVDPVFPFWSPYNAIKAEMSKDEVDSICDNL